MASHFFIRIPTTIKADILYKLTEEEWDSFCTRYIYEKLQNLPPFHTNTGYLSCKEYPIVEMSLEDPPTNNNQGSVKSSLQGKLVEYEIIKDKIDPFLDIDANPWGKSPNKTCIATARNKIPRVQK